MNTSTSDLRGFYFPFATPRTSSNLKHSLLYFDKVVLLDPYPVLDSVASRLRSHGRYSPPPPPDDAPFEAYQQWWAECAEGTTWSQERDWPNVIAVYLMVFPQHVQQITEKLLAQLDIRRAQVESFQSDTEVLQVNGALEIMRPDDPRLDPTDWNVVTKLARLGYIESIRSKVAPDPFDRRLRVSADFEGHPAVLSMAIAATLVLSHTVRATPFCGSQVTHSALKRKLVEIVGVGRANGAIEKTVDIARARGYELPLEAIGADALGIEVVERSLPDFEYTSYEDILELRHRLHDELVRFRTEIYGLSSTLKAKPWSSQFQLEITETVRAKVDPALEDLRRKIRLSNDKVFQKLFRDVRSPKASVPFVVSVFAGFPLLAAALVSAVMIGADAAVDTYFEKRELLEGSGLSFLLSAGE